MELDHLIAYLSELGGGFDEDEGPGELPRELDGSESIWEIDWGRITRFGPDPDLGGLAEQFGWNGLPAGLAPGTITGERELPAPGATWERCAWYSQISLYGHGFGIFMYQECMIEFARVLGPWVFPSGHRLSVHDTLRLLLGAFYHFFLHEQFHHKTESFAIRVSLAERRSVYAAYSSMAYLPAKHGNPSLLLEEALAGASAYRRLDEDRYQRGIGAPAIRGIREFLRQYYPLMPAGYDRAVHHLTPEPFERGLAELLAIVHEATNTPGPDWQRWALASHMSRSLLSIESRIWTILPPGARPVLPARAPLSTTSTRLLERYLHRLGFHRTGQGKGSHEEWAGPNGVLISVPRRADLTPGFLADVAKRLGLNGASQLVAEVRGA